MAGVGALCSAYTHFALRLFHGVPGITLHILAPPSKHRPTGSCAWTMGAHFTAALPHCGARRERGARALPLVRAFPLNIMILPSAHDDTGGSDTLYLRIPSKISTSMCCCVNTHTDAISGVGVWAGETARRRLVGERLLPLPSPL